jgi:hypothetical protein
MDLDDVLFRKLRTPIAVGLPVLLLCLFAIFLWERRLASSRDPAAHQPRVERETAIVESEGRASAEYLASLQVLPAPKVRAASELNKATEKERRELEAVKTSLEKSFQSWEAQRAKVVLRAEREGHSASVVAIPAPSKEEISDMASEATMALASFSEESDIYITAYNELTELIFDYIGYRDNVKFVGLSLKMGPDHESPTEDWMKDIVFGQYFASSVAEGTPREDGTIPVERIDRVERDWNSPDSWERKRYRYLFEVVEEEVVVRD